MTARLWRTLAWVAVAAAIVALLALPENRYDWMSEMDPGTRAGAIEDSSGDSRVAAGIVALLGLAAAGGIAWSAAGWPRRAGIVAGVVVAALWALKFAG